MGLGTTSDSKLLKDLHTCCNFGLKLLSLGVLFRKNFLISELFWRENMIKNKVLTCWSIYLPTFLQLLQTAEYHINLNALHIASATTSAKHLPIPANFIWN